MDIDMRVVSKQSLSSIDIMNIFFFFFWLGWMWGGIRLLQIIAWAALNNSTGKI